MAACSQLSVATGLPLMLSSIITTVWLRGKERSLPASLAGSCNPALCARFWQTYPSPVLTLHPFRFDTRPLHYCPSNFTHSSRAPVLPLPCMQDANEFEWQMQLRYYFENEDVVVRQVGYRTANMPRHVPRYRRPAGSGAAGAAVASCVHVCHRILLVCTTYLGRHAEV